jgi:paraquat-inducible protein B
MTAASRQTAVGAFVLGGAALALAAVLLFGKLHIFSPVKHAAVVFQDSIAGLSVGSPVTFRGVRVGAVDSIAIQFDPKTHVAYIPVVIQLEAGRVRVSAEGDSEPVDLAKMIARGLRAELNTQSFVTGQSEIDLDFDPASAAVLHPDITDLTEIPTRQSAIQRVKEQLSQLPLRELADNATATLQSLRGLSEKLNQGLPPLVDSLKATSDRSDAAVAAIASSIQDLQARLDTTLTGIDKLAASGDRQLNQRGADLHTLLIASAQTAARATETLTALRGLVSDRGAARANIEAALRDLAAATASLRGFAGDIEHNPQLLLTGRKP